MLFPRNGRRRGARRLAALPARARVGGIGPGVVSPGMGLAGARLLDALERRERREPSSCPPGRFMLWMSGWGSSLPPEFSAAPAGVRDRDRSRRPARLGRAAATVLVLGLLLLGAAAAEAQTARILVSNVEQTGDDSAETLGNDHAQLFHTAGATNGYVLTSVIVVSEDAEADDFNIEICEAGNTTEFPTSTCTELARPGSFAAGSLEFTHTGIHLNANDNYVVVIKQIGGGNVKLDSTTSGGEDPTGITGWSIKDKFDWKPSGAWQQKSGGDEAIQITVNGYETPPNQVATGRPVVLASAEGAPILFADTSDIADGNGLPFTGSTGSVIEFVYTYQWIRVDGDTSTETNIGVDSPRYLLVDADIGNPIKVQVSFTDRATHSETVTSLPFGPVAERAGPSQSRSTLVSNTGQSESATANITQQYDMEFTLGSHGQGYELSSVSIALAAVPPTLTVSLWIGDHSSQSSSPYTKLFDFENPSSFQVGLNKFTAPAGVLAYPRSLSGIGSLEARINNLRAIPGL